MAFASARQRPISLNTARTHVPHLAKAGHLMTYAKYRARSAWKVRAISAASNVFFDAYVLRRKLRLESGFSFLGVQVAWARDTVQFRNQAVNA